MIIFRDTPYGRDILKDGVLIGNMYKNDNKVVYIRTYNYPLTISQYEEIIEEAKKLS